MSLFDHLPDRLFSPLAGPNRRIYASLLLDLYPLFFEEVHRDVFPSRESVRHELEARLTELAVVWQNEADEDPLPAGMDADAAARAYYRLKQTGWFEEEVDGYHTRVTVPPPVGALWAVLMEVARPESVFYGGMVLSIYNNIKNAVDHPEEQALAFRQAARDARRFLQHLNTMIYGLKGILGELKQLDDHRKILGQFFDNFVDRFLVQDYKRLKTRNNPFRYRQQILHMIQELDFDRERKQKLVRGFQAQSGENDSERAWQAINGDIDRLRTIFGQVDSHLMRVDRYRARVEQRVADTVRYLDRSQPGMATRIAELLKTIAKCPGLDDILAEELRVFPLLDAIPISSLSLRDRKRRRVPPEPRVLRQRRPDPAMVALQQAIREYLRRRRFSPEGIASYLDAQMGNAKNMEGGKMQIETVEDFIAFAHLRYLEYLPGMQRLRKRYRVERQEGWIDNPWLRCSRFVVHRIDRDIRNVA